MRESGPKAALRITAAKQDHRQTTAEVDAAADEWSSGQLATFLHRREVVLGRRVVLPLEPGEAASVLAGTLGSRRAAWSFVAEMAEALR